MEKKEQETYTQSGEQLCSRRAGHKLTRRSTQSLPRGNLELSRNNKKVPDTNKKIHATVNTAITTLTEYAKRNMR